MNSRRIPTINHTDSHSWKPSKLHLVDNTFYRSSFDPDFPHRVPLVRSGQLHRIAGHLNTAGSHHMGSLAGGQRNLNHERFEVEIRWETSQGDYGSGLAVGLTADNGTFRFLVDADADVVIKVQDACAEQPQPQFWAYAYNLINLGIQMTIRDTWNGSFETYSDGHRPDVGDGGLGPNGYAA